MNYERSYFLHDFKLKMEGCARKPTSVVLLVLLGALVQRYNIIIIIIIYISLKLAKK